MVPTSIALLRKLGSLVFKISDNKLFLTSNYSFMLYEYKMN